MKTGKLPATGSAAIIDFEGSFRDAVRAILAIEPKLSAAGAAEQLLAEADPETLSAAARALLLKYFVGLVRAERLAEGKERRRDQLPLPGFEHLPQRIAIPDGRKIRLANAKLADLKRYLTVLNRSHADRLKNDSKIAEVKALMKVMAKYASKQPGITCAEVAALEDAKPR